MIRRPPRSTQSRSSAASDVYKRQAGMDRLAARDDRGRDDRRGREVAPLGVGGADADRLVGELGGERVAVRLAVRDDGPDPHGPAGTQDADGNLAAIGDEDTVEHQATPVAGAPSWPAPAAATGVA